MYESWEIIQNYPGYLISNVGRVYSYRSKRILKPQLNEGYRWVWLRGAGIDKQARIHQLVAKYFVKNPSNKPIVNHKNGIKADNRYKNLEWVTISENITHAHELGLVDMKKGEAHHESKLSKNDVKEIRESSNNFYQYELAEIYGVSQSVISDVINRKIWKHVN